MLNKVSYIAINQLRLMEQVFYTCRLDRYANAPDNRGWMNLFRSWGRSAQLNDVFATYEPFLTREFVEFYLQYITYYDENIDTRPIPHPWDPAPIRMRPPIRPVSSRRWPAGWNRRTVRGIYLDPGLREADPFRPSTSHADASDPGAAASSSQPAPPARDSSGDTD
jgi:hypothetical protein